MTLVFWIFSSVWSFHMKISSSLEDLETVMSASWMYFSDVCISISPSLNTVFLTRQYFDYEQWLTPPAAHSGFVGGVVDWNILNPPTGSLMTRGCVDDPPCIREHPLRLFKVVDQDLGAHVIIPQKMSPHYALILESVDNLNRFNHPKICQ